MAKFTEKEKIQAVKRYLEGKEGQKAIAESIGGTKAILQTWIRQYQYHGESSFKKNYTTYSADYKLKCLIIYPNMGRPSVKQQRSLIFQHIL